MGYMSEEEEGQIMHTTKDKAYDSEPEQPGKSVKNKSQVLHSVRKSQRVLARTN